MKLYRLFFLYILLELVDLVTGRSNKKLKYFEVIDSSDIRHQIRRRDVNDDSHVREITFSALGKILELELVSKPELFSRDFQAVTVDADGKETKFNINQNDFYKGFLKGQKKSSFVSAQVNDNLLTASIEIENDTYHVEPAFGHVGGNTSKKMIAYRDSDVIWNGTFAGNHTQGGRLCGVDSAKQETSTHVPNVSEEFLESLIENSIPEKTKNATKYGMKIFNDHERNRRATEARPATKTKLNCPLVLVADYYYFKNIGQRSKSKTTYSMVGVINRVDHLFKTTHWSADKDDTYKGYGFVIKKIIIHEEQSSTPVYNSVDTSRTIRALLEDFSRVDWSSFCLAHLFTYQDFKNGVIGLAYVANSYADSKGGVCSQGDGRMWHNTGLSSAINWGVQLLTTEADIVTAHELGHNFGSDHDVASNSECSPESGGKYIMYPASVSGRKENNKKFSSCSKKAVKAVLQAKSFCFQEPEESQYCGNFRIEKQEQCDAGPNADDCCTSDCALVKGAVCSSNFQKKCCSDCHFSNATKQCSPPLPLLCRKASYCDGKSDTCPKPLHADEGTDCIESGKCDKFGECKPFCETINPSYQPCLCLNDDDACYVCCKKNNVCGVYRNRTGDSERMAMRNGRLCYDGVCRKQKCEKDAQDFITRLQDFLESLADPSKFGEFLKDNIVGTVAVFSLIAWIPLSILVHRIDKRRDKAAQEMAKWNDSQNQDLIYQPDRRQDLDVVFKKDSVPSVVFRDSRSAVGRGRSPNRQRGPTVE